MFSKSTKPGQLAQTLRQEIQTGRLQPGQRLMSINDLSQVYKVSVRTVREALALLEQDGYLACRSRRRAVILTGPPQPEETLIRATLIQRGVVQDAYQTLRGLLPILLWQSGRLMKEADFDQFYRLNKKMIRFKGDHSWILSAQLFHGLLNYSGNPLFDDLYQNLEQACLLPVILGYEHPYEIMASHPQSRDFSTLLQGLQSQAPLAILNRIRRMIDRTQSHVEVYMQQLSSHFDLSMEPAGIFQWHTGPELNQNSKSRQIARSLIQAILSGELPPNSFLPAEKTMAEQYGVSVDTLRRALRYLRQLQFIRTLNGKGSQICDPDLNCFDPLASPASKRNSLTYLCALQLLCLISVPAALNAGKQLDFQQRKIIAARIRQSPNPLGELIDWLAAAQTSPSMSVIVNQIFQFLYAGGPYLYHARKLPAAGLSPDYPSDLEQVLTAMEQGQISEFAHAVYHSLQRLLDSSLDYLIQQGVGEAKRLRLPDVLPGVFLEEECECHSRSAEESFPISFPDGKIRRRS